MAGNKIVRKVHVNKRNKQLSVNLSKKELKLNDPTLKFSDELFVELRVFKKKNGKSIKR